MMSASYLIPKNTVYNVAIGSSSVDWFVNVATNITLSIYCVSTIHRVTTHSVQRSRLSLDYWAKGRGQCKRLIAERSSQLLAHLAIAIHSRHNPSEWHQCHWPHAQSMSSHSLIDRLPLGWAVPRLAEKGLIRRFCHHQYNCPVKWRRERYSLGHN